MLYKENEPAKSIFFVDSGEFKITKSLNLSDKKTLEKLNIQQKLHQNQQDANCQNFLLQNQEK